MNTTPAPTGGGLSPLVTAFELHHAGLSVIPIKTGEKSPSVPWKDYMQQQPTVAELGVWFKPGEFTGLAVVSGAVSGGLEMTEIEGKAVPSLPIIKQALEAAAPGLWERLTCVERSPSGGYHWFYRLTGAPVPGNTKIAANESNEVLAETRGERGYTIVAPTGGEHHPTGNPWVREVGRLSDPPVLTVEDRALLHCTLFHVLDKTGHGVCPACGLYADRTEPPAPAVAPVRSHPVALTGPAGEGGVSPLDDYAAKTDMVELLVGAGWSLTRGTRAGEHVELTRPGRKPVEGRSATVHSDQGAQILHVFTTSTDFEAGRSYTTAQVAAVLSHGNDSPATMSALAKDLRRDGYGQGGQVAGVDVLSFFTPGKLEPHQQTPGTAPTADPGQGQGSASAGEPVEALEVDVRAIEANLARLSLAQGTADGTDQAGALVFIAHHIDSVRATHQDDKHIWHTWEGNRWVHGAVGGIRARYMQTMTIRENDKDNVKKDKRKWQGARSMDAVLKMAAHMPEVLVSDADFDNRPYELNTPGGMVNLRTGAVLPHDPAHMHSKITTADPTDTTGREQWERFITRILPDVQVREFMQQVAGVALLGRVVEHIFIFAYGQGANGKSVFFDVLIEVLGDYATTVDAATIMHKRNERETALELGKFAHHRLVVMSEVNMDDRINEAMVKTLTGGDRLHTRALYRNGQVVRPQHTLFMAGNHRPALPSGGGHSMWRRMRVVPFTEQIPPGEQDPLLKEKLLEHGGAVLAWAIEGAVKYASAGRLVTPAAVAAETRAYRLAADPFEAFMAGALVFRAGASAGASDVSRAFEVFCANSGLSGVGWHRQEYPRRLRSAGVRVKRVTAGMIYEGVELLLEHQWSYPGES